MPKKFIREVSIVEEVTASTSFSKGEKREDYADAWKNTGNVILMGLPGAGKKALAEMLAERTGLPLVMPGDPSKAIDALSGENQIIVLDDALVENVDVQPLIHGSGKGFYLMADTNTLSDRVAERSEVEDREALWRDMSARLAVVEPMFYATLHFILHASRTMEELVDDAMEKIAY